MDLGIPDEVYSDDNLDTLNRIGRAGKKLKILSVLLLTVATIASATFAANINISTGGNQEFGQGILLTTACDNSISLNPISTYLQDQGNGSHRLTSVRLNGIDATDNSGGNDEGCRGKVLKIDAYSETGTTPIASFTLGVNPDGSIVSGDGISIATGEGSTSAQVIVNFEDSTFTSTSIYRFTIESKLESYVLTSLPNPIPGETLAALSSTTGGVLYLLTADTDGNGNCLSCKLYRSTDFGKNWSFRSTLTEFLWHIVGSADGTKLVGANWGGKIFTSNDSGATWVDRGNQDAWWHLSSSSSGQLITGVTEKIGFKLSRDYGVTWSSPLPAPNGTYIQSAITPDGRKILVSDQQILRYSDDGGVTWTARTLEKKWSAVAMSDDGSHLYATEMKDVGDTTGRIYTSTDYGLTWRASSISNSWWGIKSTADGKTVVAFAADTVDTAFISNDFGKTWQRSTVPLYIDSFAINPYGDEVLFLGGPLLWEITGLYKLSNVQANRN